MFLNSLKNVVKSLWAKVRSAPPIISRMLCMDSWGMPRSTARMPVYDGNQTRQRVQKFFAETLVTQGTHAQNPTIVYASASAASSFLSLDDFLSAFTFALTFRASACSTNSFWRSVSAFFE